LKRITIRTHNGFTRHIKNQFILTFFSLIHIIRRIQRISKINTHTIKNTNSISRFGFFLFKNFSMATQSPTTSFDTQHEDMIHDVQMNYYGRRMATCSSDKTIKIWDLPIDNSPPIPTAELKGHEAPVWQVSWSNPKFGNYLASASYDRRVLIWKELNKNDWRPVYEYSGHELSVNSIQFAPHEFGLCLACGSSDGYISILTHKGGETFSEEKFFAHNIGVNAVCWAPAGPVKRIVSGGCDNDVKIWRFEQAEGQWKLEQTLQEHNDWVRDVAWAPTIGLPNNTIASCSQDGSVIIWAQDDTNTAFHSVPLKKKSSEPAYRVSWSITGNLLAVSTGDNKVSLYKESYETPGWYPIYSMDETGQLKDQM